jgi:hypothetical protein
LWQSSWSYKTCAREIGLYLDSRAGSVFPLIRLISVSAVFHQIFCTIYIFFSCWLLGLRNPHFQMRHRLFGIINVSSMELERMRIILLSCGLESMNLVLNSGTPFSPASVARTAYGLTSEPNMWASTTISKLLVDELWTSSAIEVLIGKGMNIFRISILNEGASTYSMRIVSYLMKTMEHALIRLPSLVSKQRKIGTIVKY